MCTTLIFRAVLVVHEQMRIPGDDTGKLTDIQIRAWIRAGERFEQCSDGDGDRLYLSYRANFTTPKWLFRYRFNGKQRVMGRAVMLCCRWLRRARPPETFWHGSPWDMMWPVRSRK